MPSKKQNKKRRENYRKKRKEQRANRGVTRDLTARERNNLSILSNAFPDTEIKLHEHSDPSGDDKKVVVARISDKKNRVRQYTLTSSTSGLRRRIEGDEMHTCGICMRSSLDGTISCNRCAKSYCFDCNLSIFRAGRGIIRCPYCRNAVGHHREPFEVEIGVIEMKCKWGRPLTVSEQVSLQYIQAAMSSRVPPKYFKM